MKSQHKQNYLLKCVLHLFSNYPYNHKHPCTHSATTSSLNTRGELGQEACASSAGKRNEAQLSPPTTSLLFLQLPSNNNTNSSRRKHIHVALFLSGSSSPGSYCVYEVSRVARSRGRELSVQDTYAKGSAHCQGWTELDESLVRVEGTNKSEP